jgi:hypothetical protein
MAAALENQPPPRGKIASQSAGARPARCATRARRDRIFRVYKFFLIAP